MHRVLILGGGFGGLYAAKALRRAPVSTTLLDRRNFHLFQPLLYQVATGTLSPGQISAPLRAILRKDVQVLLGEAVDLDPQRRVVILGRRRIAGGGALRHVAGRHRRAEFIFWTRRLERRRPGAEVD